VHKGDIEMKTIHYGQDYCKVVIRQDEYELPIAIGREIDLLKDKLHRRNMQIKELKEKINTFKEVIPAGYCGKAQFFTKD